MRTVIFIPARYKSSRYPGKPLVMINGKPLVIWVAELSVQAVGIDNVYVLTEDQRILEVVEKHGFQCLMTLDTHLTGTDRLAEAAARIDADIYINVQGDEPTLDPNDIIKIIEAKKANMQYVVNGMCPLSLAEDPENVNLPKVAFKENKVMIYMSRAAIPKGKTPRDPQQFWKQVCIYAFTRDELLSFGNFGRKSASEAIEDIEILRFLELGKEVFMVETQGATYAVDVPDDVAVVEQVLKAKFGDFNG
ncbi:MAG: 3-deoxy-manno-octulosonate cytidylyltransferase [Acidobacteriota bacterium]